MFGEGFSFRKEAVMAKTKAPKVVTKKHLARQERERRQTRLIVGISIGIIGLVFLGIAYQLLNESLFLRWRTAVSVNGQKQSLRMFQERVRVARQQYINQYMQYSQLAQMFGMDPNSDPQMSQSLNQITSTLDSPSTLGGQVINNMVDDLLIRQYAQANGITVSAADVENAAQKALNYYPNGTPTHTPTSTQIIYPTLDATQMALVTSTPTPTLTLTLTPAPTNTTSPTSTPDLTSTPTPVPSLTPTATPYTLQGYQTQYQDTFKTYAALGLSDADFRYIFFESGLYSDRVKAVVTADVSHDQDQVWARHILVGDETTAKDIENQLANGGDFGALAAQYSIDSATKDNGGDLGWFGKDSTTVTAEMISAAFSMKIGEISQPIATSGGYDILQLLGHEVRPLTDQEYQTAVTNAFNDWLQKQRDASVVNINNNWVNYVPTTPTLAQALSDSNATATAYVSTYIANQSGQ
jgi:peptidyl-prolyl cis-trans isomerase D